MTLFRELGVIALALGLVGIINHYAPEIVYIPGFRTGVILFLVGIVCIYLDNKVG